MDDSSSPEPIPDSSPHKLVITLCPEIAANVSGRTNSSAAFVITTWGSYPASCSRRTSSTDLYAAIPPQTPTVTFTRPLLIPSSAHWNGLTYTNPSAFPVADRLRRYVIHGSPHTIEKNISCKLILRLGKILT